MTTDDCTDSVCDVGDTYTCVECVDETTCLTADESRCNDSNACAACESSSDCSHLSSTPACNTDGETNVCVECMTASVDSDCGDDHVCLDYLCYPECSTDDDCPNTDITTRNRCSSDSHCIVCEDQPDCGEGMVCDTSMAFGSCVECLEDANCADHADGEVCIEENFDCVQCEMKSDCDTYEGMPECLVEENTCVECLENDHCSGN